MARVYSSPLRAEQAEQTRQRLLLKLADVLADETVTEVSVADVARRAGVAVRTAYRYFPTKEDLLDAFNAGGIPFQGKRPVDPKDAGDLPRFVKELAQVLAANETVVRATRWSKTAGEVRARRKAEQVKKMMRILRPLTAHLDPDRARAITAMVHSMHSSTVWLEMRDAWDLAPEQIENAMLWALETALDKLAKESKGK